MLQFWKRLWLYCSEVEERACNLAPSSSCLNESWNSAGKATVQWVQQLQAPCSTMMTLLSLGWSNSSSRPQLLYLAIVMSIHFIPSQCTVHSLPDMVVPVPKENHIQNEANSSLRVMSHSREDSALLSPQPELRKGHGSWKTVNKVMHRALLAMSIPNYKLASCRIWPITDLKTPLPRTPSTITSNHTGPDNTSLTTEQLKKKLPNQHTSLSAVLTLNGFTDLCEHSKLHQNNSYALTGLNMLKNEASGNEHPVSCGRDTIRPLKCRSTWGRCCNNFNSPEKLLSFYYELKPSVTISVTCVDTYLSYCCYTVALLFW